MKYGQTILPILGALLASIALADDFKTINGKEYKNVRVSRVEPDGIVLKSKSGISKLYFTELPKEVQERFHYDAVKGNAYSAEQNAKLEVLRKQYEEAARQRQAAPSVGSPKTAAEPVATSGIEGLPPITAQLQDEILNALRMTDNLDALYKGGCSSSKFIAAATPIESVFVSLQHKFPKPDPRRDLFVNTLEAYQQVASEMKANDQGKGERPDATLAVAELRKHLLKKILEGNMTSAEKEVYHVWRKAVEANP